MYNIHISVLLPSTEHGILFSCVWSQEKGILCRFQESEARLTSMGFTLPLLCELNACKTICVEDVEAFVVFFRGVFLQFSLWQIPVSIPPDIRQKDGTVEVQVAATRTCSTSESEPLQALKTDEDKLKTSEEIGIVL